MIICRKRRFIFLRVPKTASTSLTFLIREKISDLIDFHTGLDSSRAVDTKLYHINLKEAIDANFVSEEEIQSFKIYAVIRDPVDRYISIANTIPHISRKEISNEEKVIQFMQMNLQGLVTQPQTHWLIYNNQLISHPIVYPQFSQFLQEEFGCEELAYTENGQQRRDKTCNLSAELQQKIRSMYPEDQALWERLSGK